MQLQWPIRLPLVLAIMAADLLVIEGCAPMRSQAKPSREAPAASGWLQYSSPEDVGFSAAKLAEARQYADSVKSGAVMVVYRGNVVAAWGDVARNLELHSVRKSVVSALFGIAASRNEISLDRTLGELGITDRSPLTPLEKSARVRDLLAARSGVYLPAAYADASQDEERPARGSHAPNTFWFYNNWDFNTLGTIYERVVDSSLYQSLERRIARPIGMQDFTATNGNLVYEPSNSIHPAHTIRMSARDLARFGQLFLQQGKWNGRQVVPHEWVEESTKPLSDVGAVNRHYAYMWWTASPRQPRPSLAEVDKRAIYYGTGTGGQLLAVIPSDELVFVHRGDTDHGRNISGSDAWHILEVVLEARSKPAVANPRLVSLSPDPLASQLPPLEERYISVDSALMAELSGNYQIAPGIVLRVFEWKNRLFGNFPGRGEAELFGLSRSEFTIRVQSGVKIRFTRDNSERINGVDVEIGGQKLRGVRI